MSHVDIWRKNIISKEGKSQARTMREREEERNSMTRQILKGSLAAAVLRIVWGWGGQGRKQGSQIGRVFCRNPGQQCQQPRPGQDGRVAIAGCGSVLEVKPWLQRDQTWDVTAGEGSRMSPRFGS